LKGREQVEPLYLEPGYSTGEVPGKCIKCLAEHELNACLRTLLMGEGEGGGTQQEYEMLLSFLRSPESKRLRDESERLLSEGRQVVLCMDTDKNTGEVTYKLRAT